MPAARIRLPRREIMTLLCSSMIATRVAAAGSVTGTVIEYPLSGYTGSLMPSGDTRNGAWLPRATT
ncbi:Uncharacterised protein [Mycobacteroides abscessus subsp. abscessus]|nr:Uncharacterised protein [Mycobacteroides abscessus subsp. abscessus]